MSRPDFNPTVRALITCPSTYGLQTGAVEVIETHAACVFLAGARAYKLKKPVDLGFLDFSAVEARHSALQAELDLNQPGAPEIYQGLIWITRSSDGGLALNGQGARVEPVLVMTRFDQDRLLDRLAVAGRVDGALARDLADAVFESHQRAERHPSGGAQAMRRLLADTAARCQVESHAPADRIDALRRGLDQRFQDHAALLDARAKAGFTRRCHGDLHLNNIVLLNARPVLFDALEFDDDLATTDTLYDLAFVVMDLIHRDLGPVAAALLSQYAARLEGELAVEGLALLPVFCGLRALIRALVHLERGQPGDEGEAAAYLDLAERCAAPVSARLIGIGGLSGTGKSTLAEGLAPDIGPPPGALVIRADLERKVLEGVGWREALPKSAYTKDASRRVYDRQREKALRALNAGVPVVMDAVHSRESERDALEHIAERAGVPFQGLWLDADPSDIRNRVARRRNDPSDADLEVVEKQAAYDAGQVGWTPLDASTGREAVLAAARRVADLT
jgi:aminoglycoside phosphotransferase family enzyme/predicted kinase